VNTVHFVVPDGIDDPARASGGNVYDREVCTALRACGWTVIRHGVPGSLRDVLRGLPAGPPIVVDGLLGCREPEAMSETADRLRLVLLVHMPAGLDGGEGEQVATEAERVALSASAAVLATSNWTRYVLISRHGPVAERIRVAEPGVDGAPPARGTAEGGRLLYVGAVARHKGLDVLVRALAQVADLPWECVCVGSLDRQPGYVAVVRGFLAQHGLRQRVRLVGAADREVLAKYYAAADVVAVPSRAEAYGMVVSEALARGLPVLAADTGGVAEALGTTAAGDRPGILVRPGDAEVWAVALRVWLTDPALRARLRELAALRRTTLREWRTTAGAMSALLADVVTA
jgi:glycosyltransferase involved in cell wall biosynthesis